MIKEDLRDGLQSKLYQSRLNCKITSSNTNGHSQDYSVGIDKTNRTLNGSVSYQSRCPLLPIGLTC